MRQLPYEYGSIRGDGRIGSACVRLRAGPDGGIADTASLNLAGRQAVPVQIRLRAQVLNWEWHGQVITVTCRTRIPGTAAAAAWQRNATLRNAFRRL